MAQQKKAPRPRAKVSKRAKRRHKVSRGEGARLVRGIRRRFKLTQAALAARLGVAQMTVCRWEAGDAPVRPALRMALTALAGILAGEKGGKRHK